MKKGLITSILALTFSGLQAQPLPATPKLVVTLTIDQLRTDYMEAFSSLYGEKGFKRLMREGRVFRQTVFPFTGTDRASAIATIYSGTTPSMNGIISQKWMDVSTLRPISCVDDPAFMGNFTDENSSPSQLLTSTVADELKIATRNRGLVYAIAPSRDAAILSAGHCGNGAFWLNENTGKWCSTTYYSEFPWWMSQYNDRKSPDYRIRDMVWEPIHPVGSYTFLPEWRDQAFKYKFDSERINRYRRLIASPFVNDEVNMLVEELLEKSNIAKDEVPDLLALTYYAGNYNHKSTQECAMEMQDTYARLDRSIAALIDLIDRKVGLQNVLFCIASTGYTDAEAPDLSLYRIPGGEFYPNRCATLLNMYLMATYGEGQYVETHHNGQIYLNHKLIENKQLDLAEIQDKSADFLIQFSGVNEAYSAHRLLQGTWSPQIELVRNAFHRKRSGDLLIDVLPGWTIVEENNANNRVVRHADIPAPLIFMGGGVKAETIKMPVDVTHIAPTLSGVMRIRAPNACKGKAISLSTAFSPTGKGE
ncbi:alkaline phosphatase family protein [uncultured Bacteroides sp.]|uniref:alkaline phosphatase family protein n=1 Tax=uncultured Bacteroides sp. TaxID=162156 RepID=UPI0023D155D4|nr:alkaline phosphatase family protein [uncultured Bacteroides sp.]MDE6173862.1 alkaline phosphatase family protein [Bacteroides sp.]